MSNLSTQDYNSIAYRMKLELLLGICFVLAAVMGCGSFAIESGGGSPFRREVTKLVKRDSDEDALKAACRADSTISLCRLIDF